MSLCAGDSLGPYQIVNPIGSGGMGTVYRARDTRLQRDVAIKVSSGRFSERFEREARTVAQLNHASICTLFDVGPDYLVMELVEAELATFLLPVIFAQFKDLKLSQCVVEIFRIIRAAHCFLVGRLFFVVAVLLEKTSRLVHGHFLAMHFHRNAEPANPEKCFIGLRQAIPRGSR